MEMTLAELIEKGFELPLADQYELASRLLAHAEESTEDQAEVNAAWKTEFRRRINDIESGHVQLVDHDETVRQARARVAARRASHSV